VLLVFFLGVPSVYYSYLFFRSRRPWKLKINDEYAPAVTVIVPAHNEEKIIKFKLMNLSRVEYPKDKIQVLLIDDASTDGTVLEASKFAVDHPELGLEIINEKIRKGKSAGLNTALAHAKNDIVIVSDADTFWASDILTKALPFLSDPSVGAVSGRQFLLAPGKSLLTQTEKTYLDLTYNLIKLGESKIHSTILFHGLFSAYNKQILGSFNLETDDSGTALDIVQRGARTIYAPEARCYEVPPFTWKGKIRTKFRRANQLIGIYVRCLKLLFKRRLSLPLKIAVPEILLYLVNPIVFLLLIPTALVFFWFYPTYLLYSIVILLVLIAVSSRFRLLLPEAIQDNFILLISLFTYAFGRRFSIWETLAESRNMVNEETLKSENLI
jgi:cellulose synthase/poly-beta-1,6-N-acetylglucosamine synthase-like glycosyltransferase